MNHLNPCLEACGQLLRLANRPRTARIGIHRAYDGADDRFVRQRRIFVMNAGPDWASRVMQNLGGDRTEQKSPESAMGVGGHENQITALLARKFDDSLRRIALENHRTIRSA